MYSDRYCEEQCQLLRIVGTNSREIYYNSDKLSALEEKEKGRERNVTAPKFEDASMYSANPAAIDKKLTI